MVHYKAEFGGAGACRCAGFRFKTHKGEQEIQIDIQAGETGRGIDPKARGRFRPRTLKRIVGASYAFCSASTGWFVETGVGMWHCPSKYPPGSMTSEAV